MSDVQPERCWLCKEDSDAPVCIAFEPMMSGPGWFFYGCPRCVKLFRIIPVGDQADDERYGSLQYEVPTDRAAGGA